MCLIVVFCTTADAPEAVVLDFNENCSKDDPSLGRVFYNHFTPARHDRRLVSQPSREPISLTPDSFADYAIDQLREYIHTLGSERSANRIVPGIFAVLDEQGVQDRTVVIHYYHIPPMDPDYPPDDPRQMEECFEPDGDLNPKWLTWRFEWKHAYSFTSCLMLEPAMTYEVYMNRPERFVDEKGVYDVDAAIRGA